MTTPPLDELPHQHRTGPRAAPPDGDSDDVLRRQAQRESSARSYPRRIPRSLVRGSGSTVWDARGDAYLDCLAGAGALALGHHHPAVTEALRDALEAQVPLTTLDLATPIKDRFTSDLLATLPAPLAEGRIQFCGPTGADAVEAALKLCRTATGRQPLVAFGGAYHGMTAGALALTGAHGPKEAVGPLVGGVHHLPFPASYRCPFGVGGDAGADLAARTLRWALSDDHSGITTPAGVFAEPVQGEGGVHPMPTRFATALRTLTAEHGVPLVLDEVQTGLGRTGTLWGFERLGIVPDVLVLSKAIGGGLPLAVLVHRSDLDAFAPGAHAGTFRGNQLAMAAGSATIREVVAAGLAARAEELGGRIVDGLRATTDGAAVVGDVRGAGLMVGVELVDPDRLDADGVPVPDGARARAVQGALLDLGVIAEVGGRGDAVLRLLPPLVLTDLEAERVVDAIGRAVALAAASTTHAASGSGRISA